MKHIFLVSAFLSVSDVVELNLAAIADKQSYETKHKVTHKVAE